MCVCVCLCVRVGFFLCRRMTCVIWRALCSLLSHTPYLQKCPEGNSQIHWAERKVGGVERRTEAGEVKAGRKHWQRDSLFPEACSCPLMNLQLGGSQPGAAALWSEQNAKQTQAHAARVVPVEATVSLSQHRDHRDDEPVPMEMLSHSADGFALVMNN